MSISIWSYGVHAVFFELLKIAKLGKNRKSHRLCWRATLYTSTNKIPYSVVVGIISTQLQSGAWPFSRNLSLLVCTSHCEHKSEKHGANSQNTVDARPCPVVHSNNLRLSDKSWSRRLCHPLRTGRGQATARGCYGINVIVPSRLWSCTVRVSSIIQSRIASTDVQRHYLQLHLIYQTEFHENQPENQKPARKFAASRARTFLSFPLNWAHGCKGNPPLKTRGLTRACLCSLQRSARLVLWWLLIQPFSGVESVKKNESSLESVCAVNNLWKSQTVILLESFCFL